MTCQIEIGVVGHVEDRIRVAHAVIGNVQGAGGLQGIGDLNLGLTGETLVAVGAGQGQGQSRLRMLLHLPHAVAIAIAGVEIVAVIIGFQGVGAAVEGKVGLADAVGITANGGTQKYGACGITGCIIITQHHIVSIAVPIGYKQIHQGCTEICNSCFQPAAADGI